MSDPSASASPIRPLVGAFVIAAIVAGVASTLVFIALDRYDGGHVEIVPSALPTITVDVRGAVATPGVISLPAGARLIDAITSVGGLSANADETTLNLAARVGDGEVVAIPETAPATPNRASAPPTTVAAAGSVNINTASVAELEELPGIGPVIGERIVAYRDANGPYQSVDALAEVDGISDTLLEKLRPLVTVHD